MFRSYYLLFLCSLGAAKPNLKIDLSMLDERAIGKPSKETGRLVAQWNPQDGTNPEELGEYAQGDILFNIGSGLTRNGLKAESTRWPNAIIPFEIKGNFDAFEMAMIEEAMNDYHKNTCIHFMPRTGREKDYISIVSTNTGCWSSVGRTGGKQEVNLQTPACLKRKGTVIHELMHAVGFLHEQNRENRDNHVSIVWQNIKKNHEHNFNKAPKSSTNDFGIYYDYGSVMHYSDKAFSINGQRTIVPSSDDGSIIGQREGFSVGDLRKINKMYNCP